MSCVIQAFTILNQAKADYADETKRGPIYDLYDQVRQKIITNAEKVSSIVQHMLSQLQHRGHKESLVFFSFRLDCVLSCTTFLLFLRVMFCHVLSGIMYHV